jgi:acid phosphatase (class A)
MNSPISKITLRVSARSLLVALAFGWAVAPPVSAQFGLAASASVPSAPAALDIRRLLPPPPTDPVEAAEDLAEVKRVTSGRTPERYAAAQWDDAHEDASIFVATLGPQFDLKALPATAELMEFVRVQASQAGKVAKTFFARNRPWAVDSSIPNCDPEDVAKPATSYPSGHAMIGYSTGLVLAELMPEQAQAILTRAQEYAFSRVVCGSHYPTDVRASETLSTHVVTNLMRDSAFQVKLEAARTELRAAKLIQ